MEVKNIFHLVFICIILLSGCNRIDNEVILTTNETHLIIWDPDKSLSSNKAIIESLYNNFQNIHYLELFEP